MNPVIKFFRGTATLLITGVAQEDCFNRLAEQKIPFWDLERVGELESRCTLCRRDVPRAEAAVQAAQCTAQVLEQKGLRQVFYGLWRRPVLLMGLAAVVAALLVLPNFVWTLDVQGNETVQEAEILHALEELNVKFGTWGPDINSQDIKNRILNMLPKLRWCAVNRSGGCVTVLVAEREPEAVVENEREITNVVAARTGIITQMNVMQGFKSCAVGDTVMQGQLLVSGYADWTTGTQAVHALAEIYALTWRQQTVATPQLALEKQYTGSESTRYTLVAGRKRINLSGNSGIPQGKCDKIVERKVLSLPGGYSFPLVLEIETLREYETAPVRCSKAAAELLLLRYARGALEDDMIAGTILTTQHSVRAENGRWVLRADNACEEMIARMVPAPIFESETKDSWQNE